MMAILMGRRRRSREEEEKRQKKGTLAFNSFPFPSIYLCQEKRRPDFLVRSGINKEEDNLSFVAETTSKEIEDRQAERQ